MQTTLSKFHDSHPEIKTRKDGDFPGRIQQKQGNKESLVGRGKYLNLLCICIKLRELALLYISYSIQKSRPCTHPGSTLELTLLMMTREPALTVGVRATELTQLSHHMTATAIRREGTEPCLGKIIELALVI